MRGGRGQAGSLRHFGKRKGSLGFAEGLEQIERPVDGLHTG